MPLEGGNCKYFCKYSLNLNVFHALAKGTILPSKIYLFLVNLHPKFIISKKEKNTLNNDNPIFTIILKLQLQMDFRHNITCH